MLLSTLVSLAVVALVATQLDLRQLTEVLGRVSPRWLGAAGAVYLLNYILRTLRFRLLIPDRRLRFWPLFSVTALYGMFLYLMPAKTGEISLLALLKARAKVDVPDSAATLVVARFFDFFSIALFLPLVLLAFWHLLPPAVSCSALAFLGAVALAATGYFLWLRRWSPATPPTADGPVEGWRMRARRWLHRVAARLATLSHLPGQGRLLGLTVLIWLAVYTNFYLLAGSLGYWLEFGQVVVLSLLMVPLTLFPLQGVANLGAHEAGWVAALTIFGYSSDEALVVAAGSHVILLALVLLLGALGQVVGWLSRQPEEPAPGEPTTVYASPNPLVRWAANRFLRCVTESASEVGSERIRALDAGCGEGFLTRALAQAYPYGHLVPLDVDRRRLQVAKRGTSRLDVVAASVYELPFAEDTFDLVLANELLEHLHNPSRASAELQRVCKRCAILSVPLEPFFSLANLCRGAHIRRLGRTPAHVNFWSRQGFLNLLRSSGWKIVRVRRCLIWTVVTARVP